MALCVNQSGTWREITTNCVNNSGTWRNIQTGCINQSGTWRCYGFPKVANCPLGSYIAGGFVICKAGGVGWIVAPSSTEVSRSWYSTNDAVTTAQANAACGDWFVPTIGQLSNPGYVCRTYWDSYSSATYWSSTQVNTNYACFLRFSDGFANSRNKTTPGCVRAFRCVTY